MAQRRLSDEEQQARLAAYVKETVDKAPPLSDQERAALAQLLRVPRHDEGAARQPRIGHLPPAARRRRATAADIVDMA